MYYTYIIRCKDNSIYTGMTNNIEDRYNKFKKKQELITKEIERLQSTSIKPSEEINNELLNLNSSKIQTGFYDSTTCMDFIHFCLYFSL